jgi:knotted carbamoyltransferase YgeW
MNPLRHEALTALIGKNLLLTQDWSTEDIQTLAELARTFEARDRAGKSSAFCPDELAYAVFFDNSTRTKSAWAGAASRLGMRPVIVDGSSTQVSHGETAEETGAMLGMNAHAMGIRHDLILGEGNPFMRDIQTGINDYLAATGDPRKVPVVNLQCDVDHPTQAMADLLWLQESFPEGLQGKNIAVSWAYSPSYAKPLSVPQGLITLLSRFGANLTLAHPPGYELLPQCVDAARSNAEASGGSFRLTHSMDDAFQGAHVVYPKSWGPIELMMERVEANRRSDTESLADIEERCLNQNAEHSNWICDERRMASTSGGEALYMHCLPADIGDEVTQGVMDKYRTHVAREANKKIYVIMALLAAAKVRNLADRLK